jgi:hypothetical protein
MLRTALRIRERAARVYLTIVQKAQRNLQERVFGSNPSPFQDEAAGARAGAGAGAGAGAVAGI